MSKNKQKKTASSGEKVAKLHVDPPSPQQELLTEAIEELRAHLEIIRQRRKELQAGSFDKDLTNTAAAVGRTIKDLVAEERQQEKHQRTSVDAMTEEEHDAALVRHMMEIPKTRRDKVRKLILEVFKERDKSEGGVLGL